MTQIRDVLVHVSVIVAIRQRKCHRSSKHHVNAGDQFLSIRDTYSLGSKNYCQPCAREIIALALEKITIISKKFD